MADMDTVLVAIATMQAQITEGFTTLQTQMDIMRTQLRLHVMDEPDVHPNVVVHPEQFTNGDTLPMLEGEHNGSH